jgi:hypothetical protein
MPLWSARLEYDPKVKATISYAEDDAFAAHLVTLLGQEPSVSRLVWLAVDGSVGEHTARELARSSWEKIACPLESS